MTYLDGQFLPRQPIQFVGGQLSPRKALADITLALDFNSIDASAAGSSQTFTDKSSAGPFTVLILSWQSTTTARTLSSATWGGNAVTIHVQTNIDGGSTCVGVAILSINGAQASGDIVCNFNNTVNLAFITVVSLSNVANQTPIDTDSGTSATGAADLDSLASPLAGGIRIAGYANVANGTATTWTNATDISDVDVTVLRHASGYDTGDDATAIQANAAADDEAIVGVSWR
jgi:hypothetical protein